MADATWGMRMPEELKEKIGNMLKESGLSGKEFMESLINMYELQQVKDVRAELLPDIEELESLVKRLCSIYVNMGERVNTIITDKENTYQSNMAEKITEIGNFKECIKEVNIEKEELMNKSVQLEADKVAIEKEKVDMEIRLNNEIKQLSEVNQSNKALIEEYKQKNDTLSGLLSEYKEYKDKVQELNVRIDQLRNNNRDLQSGIKDTEHELNTCKDKMAQAEEQHRREIENLNRALTQEKKEALLELKETMNNQIQELRDKHNAEIDKYNTKVKALFDELEARQKEKSGVEEKKVMS